MTYEKPRRIQRQRVKGWRTPENTVNVTRPGKWGNPFKIGMRVRPLDADESITIETNAQAAQIFRNNAMNGPGGFVFRENVRKELRGKNLACWCDVSEPCHGDILLEIANERT